MNRLLHCLRHLGKFLVVVKIALVGEGTVVELVVAAVVVASVGVD